MAEAQKTIVPTTEAPVVEPTPAPADTLTADKPAEVVVPITEPTTEPTVVPTVEEPAKTEEETVAPVEEKKEEKPVEPIYSGALGYKAPGLKNVFRFSKKYFWFGEEAVPASSLGQFLRGEKDAEHAHTVAAWSSVTGKGLVYFVKHADQKETPAGVLKLADATDLTKDGTVAFFFKLHGHKHTFEAQTAPERNGWFVAFEKAIEEAKTASEGIVASETYTEQLAKLGKPAALAATAAKEGTTPKKSTDATPKLAENEAAVVPTIEGADSVPARTGSSSSSDSDEEKRRKAAKSKSRSVSRGKRSSIFGGLLGKKEKLEEKKEEKAEKKEEEAEAKKAEEIVPPVTPLAESSTVADPVLATDLPKPAEETKAEETPAPVVAPVAEEKPKPTKRGSIFGNFVEKLKSPTTEKKESDLVPAPAPVVKEPEVAAEAPKIEDPAAPVVPVTEGTTEAPKTEETKPATGVTPHKEKSSFSFGKFLGGGKEKVKSPSAEKVPSSEAPKLEDPVKVDDAPVLAPVETVAPIEPAAVTEAPKEEEAPIGVTSTASATTPSGTQKKRGSIFGNLTGGSVKKEKDGEASEKPKGLSGLFRSASKATKTKKEEKPASTPAKVDETTEPKEEVLPTEEKKAETPAVTEPQTIGDVGADAVTVGQAPKSNPEVATTA